MRTGPYTYGEEHAIAVLAPLGAHYVARILDRDVECVRRKASRLGVSVKKKSEIDVREMSETQLRVVVRLNPGLLCPSCGKRFVNTPSGVCDLCHLNALKTNHDAEYRRLALEAKRDYNVAKKRLSVLRKNLGIEAPGARGGDASA
jgi:NMD protein affecting ribosome stability and mRNA decay